MLLLCACFCFYSTFSAPPHQRPIAGKPSPAASTDPALREKLVNALKQLQAVFVSGDKEQIAGLITFPFAPGIYADDSALSTALEASGGQLTREMFLKYYPQLSETFEIPAIQNMFRNARLDALLQDNELRTETKVATEPCYTYYSIQIEGNTVALTIGSGVNDSYKGSATLDDGTPVNTSESCDYLTWWEFRYDGEKLLFVKIDGAG